MADADVVQHPNPELPAAPNAAPVKPAPVEQPQPAGQVAAVPAANQQGLEVIILLPKNHDLRSLLFLFLKTMKCLRRSSGGKAALKTLVDDN